MREKRSARPTTIAHDARRRQLLLAGAAAGLAPAQYVLGAESPPSRGLTRAAEAAGGPALHLLPRIALVIGNSTYADSPLRNPGNDARAISTELQKLGFSVDAKLDAGRTEMAEAIQAFGAALTKARGIGLFFYAGHGVQLAWRNYLVPVDAVIDRPDDVRERAVELNALLQVLTRASNPMNVIILDACRDNPFGKRVVPEQRGLSQFDAPPGSLLAYATAPGNVASDGDGINGLYTENLLRELRVPEAKIEDVFKRVRLHVRRRTNGQQIPWESTSLEDDFYFVLPRPLAEQAEAARERERQLAFAERRRAEEEAERRRKQELAELERRRIEEETERQRKLDAALKEAQRIAEEAERKRREEQALLEAKRAQEEAERRRKQELAELERRRVEEDAQLKRKLALAEEERQRALAEAERQLERAPAPVAKPDARLAARLFEEELALWEKIKDSADPKPLEDYLLSYPSGQFSELAQFQLDRLLARLGEKRIELASSVGNPYTQGTVRMDTRYRFGDSYTYRDTDLYTGVEIGIRTETITEITDTQVVFSHGVRITDLLGNPIKDPIGRTFTANQNFATELTVGRRWTSRYIGTNLKGERNQIELELRVAARERVTVGAGTFDAYRVEGHGWVLGMGASIQNTYWLAPDRVRRWIRQDYLQRLAVGKVIQSSRSELIAYSQA